MDRVSKAVLTMMAGGVILISIIITIGTGELSALKDSADRARPAAKDETAPPSTAQPREEQSNDTAEYDLDEEVEDDFSDYGEPTIDLDGDDVDDNEVDVEEEAEEVTNENADDAEQGENLAASESSTGDTDNIEPVAAEQAGTADSTFDDSDVATDAER